MIEHVIYSLLSNSVPVSALVSSRIYPIMLPQNAAYPAISYQVSEDGAESSYDGQGTFQRVSVEIDAWSDTHAGMLTLADEITNTLKNYSGTNSGVVIDKITIDSAVSVFETEIEKFRKTLIITLFRR